MGELPGQWDAAVFCPGREDFVRVWRWLASPAELPMEELLRHVPPGMHPLQVCLCLVIMQEMRLATVSLESDDTLRAVPIEGCAKVDLNQSAILRSLRTAQRRVHDALMKS